MSSAVKSSQLVSAVAANRTTVIKRSSATVTGSGTEKRIKIVVSAGSNSEHNARMGRKEYVVCARNMSPQIQRIHRSGSKIVSIREVV